MNKLRLCAFIVAAVLPVSSPIADNLAPQAVDIAFSPILPTWGGPPSTVKGLLTNGSYATKYFPTKTTDDPYGWVGWDYHNISGYVTITVNLGSVCHITGAMLHTAAYDGGSFSNDWPAAIVVLVRDLPSDDWHFATELVSQSCKSPGLPPLRPSSGPGSDWDHFPSGLTPATAYDYPYTASGLSNYGQYVQFVIASSGCIYVDELAVYGTANQNGTPSGESVTAVDDTFVQKTRVRTGAIRRIISDAKAVQTKTGTDLTGTISSALAIPLSGIDPTTFTTRLPLTIGSNLHASVFAPLAGYWHNESKVDPVAWQPASPWDPMNLMDNPTGDAPSIHVTKMAGEYRSAAFNLTLHGGTVRTSSGPRPEAVGL